MKSESVPATLCIFSMTKNYKSFAADRGGGVHSLCMYASEQDGKICKGCKWWGFMALGLLFWIPCCQRLRWVAKAGKPACNSYIFHILNILENTQQ